MPLGQLHSLQYTAEVAENEANLEVVRLSVTDMDEAGSAAWRAVYKIVQGDEGGFFRVSTDPESNEGVVETAKVRIGLVSAVLGGREKEMAGSKPLQTIWGGGRGAEGQQLPWTCSCCDCEGAAPLLARGPSYSANDLVAPFLWGEMDTITEKRGAGFLVPSPRLDPGS